MTEFYFVLDLHAFTELNRWVTLMSCIVVGLGRIQKMDVMFDDFEDCL